MGKLALLCRLEKSDSSNKCSNLFILEADEEVRYKELLRPIRSCDFIPAENATRDVMEKFFQLISVESLYLEGYSADKQLRKKLDPILLKLQIADTLAKCSENTEMCNQRVEVIVSTAVKIAKEISDMIVIMKNMNQQLKRLETTCSLAKLVSKSLSEAYINGSIITPNVDIRDGSTISSPVRPRQVYGKGIAPFLAIVSGLSAGLLGPDMVKETGLRATVEKVAEKITSSVISLMKNATVKNPHSGIININTRCSSYTNPAFIPESDSQIVIIDNFCESLKKHESSKISGDIVKSGLLYRSVNSLINRVTKFEDSNYISCQIPTINDDIINIIISFTGETVLQPLSVQRLKLSCDQVSTALTNTIHDICIVRLAKVSKDCLISSAEHRPEHLVPPNLCVIDESTPILLDNQEPNILQEEHKFDRKKHMFSQKELFDEARTPLCPQQLSEDDVITRFHNYIGRCLTIACNAMEDLTMIDMT